MHKSKHVPYVTPTGTTFGLRTTSKPGVGNLSGDVIPEGSNHANKAMGATFGKPKGTLKPDPQNPIKKGTGTFKLPEGMILFKIKSKQF